MEFITTLYIKTKTLKLQREFWKDYAYFKEHDRRFSINKNDVLQCHADNTSVTHFDRHYVYHTAWAARHLATMKPQQHVGIDSDIRHVTLFSAFVPIEYYDYRPAQISLSKLTYGAMDLKALSYKDNSIASLSCMHVVKHVGLDRYGDHREVNGDPRAI